MIYNTKIIDYGDYLHVQWYEKPIQRVEFPDEVQAAIDQEDKKSVLNDGINERVRSDEDKKRCLKVSANRSKNNIFHIARSNQWDYFLTFTFHRDKTKKTYVDCSDYDASVKAITIFLNNQRRKNPCMKYIIVPELHSDNIHYHFHGLIANCENMVFDDSGVVDHEGNKIYNIIGWKHGFTTASKIKDQSKVRNYIGKYITKDLMNKLKFKKRYFCSQNLYVAPEEHYQFSIDEIYSMFGDNISYIKTENINGINKIKYIEVKKDVD